MRRQPDRLAFYVASWCLDYPTDALLDRSESLRAAAEMVRNETSRTALLAVVSHVQGTPLNELQRRYVEVFDLDRDHALHLSYWTDGDTRRRGEVLLQFKQRYRASGFLVNTRGELQDYLPLVLEYAAVADPEDGRKLLQEYRPSLELLRFGLMQPEPLYAGVVTAVCAELPGASPASRMAAHQMAAAGPPREQVGLEPYDARLLPMASSTSGAARTQARP